MTEVRDLNIGDLLGLLESPQEEVAQEVRVLLKETFSTVRESWLITGLLEYFYISNSGRLLDILLGVSEPHDRHLLDKLMEGLKGPDRFRHTCILLYAVRRQPPPTWLHKFLHHGAMKELLRVLAGDEDVPVLVGAVMVVVILLPTLPLEMGRSHLNTILEIFCRLVRWTPRREGDEAFQPFLQVAVYSLFHRLYALYPCHFLTCLRSSFSKPNSSACFFSTLKPMMEKVRLHPLLITETKESELTRNRWRGLETHQLILECAKVCLDPIESTCEDVCGSFFILSTNSDSAFDALPLPTNWLLYAVENNFWSPSLAVPSPASLSSTPRGSSSSVPHTPVFTINASSLKQVGRVAESPPEAAIEATPETTPFTSPMKMESSSVVGRRPNTAVCALTLNTALGKDKTSNQVVDVETCSSPLSPARKDQSSFKFPDDRYQDIFSRAERSSLINSKLQEILKEREQHRRENSQVSENKVDSADSKESQSKDIKEGQSKDTKEGKEKSLMQFKKVIAERQNSVVDVAENEACTKLDDNQVPLIEQGSRRRKMSMYDCKIDLSVLGVSTEELANGNDLDFTHEPADKYITENCDKSRTLSPILDRRISEEKESDCSESRRSSDENQPCDTDCDETETLGLGVPNQRSMTDLVKNMKTMRLRFLSQCGPPPDLSQYNTIGVVRTAVSPTKPGSLPFKSLHTSSSCPDLSSEDVSLTTIVPENRSRKESSLTLSPIRQAVVTSEATTQTEETTVVNPYEQLLDALLSGPTPGNKSKTSANPTSEIDMSSPSPHELLDQYLQFSSKTGSESRNILWQQTNQLGFPYEGLRNQVRLLQVVLLIERHKREVHAERNRRLLGRAKKVYALEEQHRGLQAKVSHLEGQVAHLKTELTNLQMNSSTKEQMLQSALLQQEAKITQILVERDNALEDRNLLKEQCTALTNENTQLHTQLQCVQATLLDKDRQLAVHARMSEDNTILRNQVDSLHKQVCLMGEIQDQYKQEVSKLTLAGGPAVKVGIELERTSAQRQIGNLEEQCRSSAAGLDAALSRVAELEALLAEKMKEVEQEQQAIKAAREAGAEQCRAVELRCQSLSSTNQTLESAILEQHDKIDRLVRQVRRSQRGKSVCSDGFDIDYELSASPSSTGGDSVATPPEGPLHPLGPLLARQPVVLSKLDALAEPETEPEGPLRRKT